MSYLNQLQYVLLPQYHNIRRFITTYGARELGSVNNLTVSFNSILNPDTFPALALSRLTLRRDQSDDTSEYIRITFSTFLTDENSFESDFIFFREKCKIWQNSYSL